MLSGPNKGEKVGAKRPGWNGHPIKPSSELGSGRPEFAVQRRRAVARHRASRDEILDVRED